VATASRALGVRQEDLRYVVLDGGSAGGRGISPTPARIAVLLAALRSPGPAAVPPRASEASGNAVEAEEPAAGQDVGDEIRAVVRALARVLESDLTAAVEDAPDALWVRLSGPGTDVLLEDEGAGFRALEHLLQRGWRGRLEPRRLAVECEGFRGRRDAALADRARALAEEVRKDGRARTLEALNAYERRIVHMALGADPEIQTYSVGEGADRRVTIARRAPPESNPSATPRED
jgi:spoIIIJ-associated protein